MKLDHQKIKKVKIHLKKSNFSRLRIFLSVLSLIFSMTSSQFFTKMQDDSKEIFNMKVIDIEDIYNYALLMKS